MQFCRLNAHGEPVETVETDTSPGPEWVEYVLMEKPVGVVHVELVTDFVDGRVVSRWVDVDVGVAEKRRWEYPPIGDQLDALWKGGDALAEMQARIMAVKEKYPKEL
jgi:hypothetical protein